jgi:hypothetical protein
MKVATKTLGGLEVDLFGRAHLLENTLFQNGDAMPQRHRFLLVMGHIEGGDTELLLQLFEFGAGLVAQLGIQVGEWLVHQEHFWLADNRPREGDPLTLPTGERAGQSVEQGFDAQHLSDLPHPLIDLLLDLACLPIVGQLPPEAAQLAQAQAEGDVVIHAHVGIERVVLEHHRHIAVAG